MKFIVVDLEATCWKGKAPNQSEIIEIGAVIVDEHKQIISEFSKFVKPNINPVLSEFCTTLTTITQSDINSAQNYPIVHKQFINWIEKWCGNNYCICSWGNYDKSQFIKDCNLHISLKHQYKNICGLKRAIGMKGALQREGMEITGIHHRGIDDARNIAKIFIEYFNNWSVPLI